MKHTIAINRLLSALAWWYLRVAWVWLLLTQAAHILWLWVSQGVQASTLFGSVGLYDGLERLLDASVTGTLVIFACGALLSLGLLGLWLFQLRSESADLQLLDGMMDAIGGLSCYLLATASTAIIEANHSYALLPPPRYGPIAVVVMLDIVLAAALVLARVYARHVRPDGTPVKHSQRMQQVTSSLAPWYLWAAWVWLLVIQVADILWLWERDAVWPPTICGTTALVAPVEIVIEFTLTGTLVISALGLLLLVGVALAWLSSNGIKAQLWRNTVCVLGGLTCMAAAIGSAFFPWLPDGYYPPPGVQQYAQIAAIVVLDIVLGTAMVWARRKYA